MLLLDESPPNVLDDLRNSTKKVSTSIHYMVMETTSLIHLIMCMIAAYAGWRASRVRQPGESLSSRQR